MRHIIIICLILLSVVAKAESIHFKVISKIKQVDLKDVGPSIDGNGQTISIDGDFLTFSTGSKSFEISEELYEETGYDKYYSFVYFDKKRKYYTTVLFNNDGTIIVLITDSDGVGYLYNVELTKSL